MHEDFIPTLLQMDLKRYEKFRSEYSFLKPFNVMVIIESHDIVKQMSWEHREIIKQLGPDHEVSKLFKEMLNALSSLGWVRYNSESILKKYKHNIMEVLSDNELILSTKSKTLLKEEVGNKAFKLWEMTQLNMPVPDAFFLTFAATRICYASQAVLPGTVKHLMHYFDNAPIAIRSSGLESMPGMLETVYIEDSSNWEKVQEAIMQVVNSWYADKAVKYRKLCKIDDLMQIGVIIQKLVKADNEDGFAGIAYSRNPNTGEEVLNGEVVLQEMGEALASGKKTPQNIATIKVELFSELTMYAKQLEEKYKAVQYIEFAYDGEKMYMLQCRDAKLSDYARGIVAIEYFKKGWMDSTRFARLYEELKDRDSLRQFNVNGEKPLTVGIASSNGYVTGVITTNASEYRAMFTGAKNKEIWFTNITTTEDLNIIKAVDAIVTTQGGYTSHPAEVSRQLQKPSIVSAKNVKIFKKHITINGEKFNEGDIVTIIGDTGEIFRGEVEVESVFVLEKKFKEIFDNEKKAK